MLRDELSQTRGAELTVTSPCEGFVLRLAVNAAGAVVQEGDLLAELVCASDRLQAVVHVGPGGAGRIKPGQVVRPLPRPGPSTPRKTSRDSEGYLLTAREEPAMRKKKRAAREAAQQVPTRWR